MPTMNHLIDPNRKVVKPITDGIAVGTIRTRPEEHQFCACEEPKFDPYPVRRIYVFDAELERTVELKRCVRCGLGRKAVNAEKETAVN